MTLGSGQRPGDYPQQRLWSCNPSKADYDQRKSGFVYTPCEEFVIVYETFKVRRMNYTNRIGKSS